MHLKVKDVSGLSILVDVPHGTQAMGLKRIIYDHLGVAPIYQNLVFRGKVMKDEDVIDLYGVRNNSIIFLAIKKRISDKKIEEIHRKLEVEYTEQLYNNPEVKNLVNSKPHLFNEYEIDDYVQQNLQMIKNPNCISEINRLNDLAMNNMEAIPGGFNEIAQNFMELEETDFDSIFADYEKPKEFKTILGPKANEPSTEPLPMLVYADNDDEFFQQYFYDPMKEYIDIYDDDVSEQYEIPEPPVFRPFNRQPTASLAKQHTNLFKSAATDAADDDHTKKLHQRKD